MATFGWRTQDLPDDCWALVLSGFKSKADRDAAALTCRRWRSLDRLSRHSLRFMADSNFSEDQRPCLHLSLLQALQSFPNIFSITIQSPFLDLCVFPHKGFTQLTFLDISLSKAHMNDHIVQCVAVNCPSLTHLSFGTSHITDAGMYLLARRCPLLQFLGISCCSITDKGIGILLLKCADMRRFSVKGCDIQGWGFRHGKRLEKIKASMCNISDAGLAKGVLGLTSLRVLNLSHTQGRPGLSSIWECCKGLEMLNLKGLITLDDSALENIVESCKNLRGLNVSWCHRVMLDGWETLALFGRKLEKLAVVGCDKFNSECLLMIAEGCPNLRLLKVSDAFVCDASLAHFRASRPAVEVKFYDLSKLNSDH